MLSSTSVLSSAAIFSFTCMCITRCIPEYGSTCQKVKDGHLPHSTIRSNGYQENENYWLRPLVESHYSYEKITDYLGTRQIVVRHALVNYPYKTMSVYEHGNCALNRTLATKLARHNRCLVAVNAGFFLEFAPGSGCLGNIVSDGHLIHDSEGIQNVHFGIKENGDIYVGYLSQNDLLSQKFIQLIGGVIWLIRDGEINIDESIDYECPGPKNPDMQNFSTSLSARTAVAVDKTGKAMLMQIDGNTHERGIGLHEFANILLKYGAVQAVNLDGGGSSSYLINGTLVNYPPDICKDDERFRCERPVSTILCVHAPECDPIGCSDRGHCNMGKCECYYPWIGRACTRLKCYNGCSLHGKCSPRGCECEAGWYGIDCSQPCEAGKYGIGCKHECACLHGATCNPVDGVCHCAPGYTGKSCENACPSGYFGHACRELCRCKDGCPCHPVSGTCNMSDINHDLLHVCRCFINEVSTEKKIRVSAHQNDDYRLMKSATVVLVLVASVSTLMNIILLYKLITKRTGGEEDIPRYKQP